ncbi:MAG: MOSC domain-containing protein [Kyrpidia sp.]|nr:MOSC domain-containing protein [Kyrpidia sp.]
MKGRIVAIHVGKPRWIPGSGDGPQRPWRSAIFKAAVEGPVWLGTTNLQGDEQADLKHHGGPDKAVLAYCTAHYPLWRAELGLPLPSTGGFGENFALSELTEADVCIGDIFRVGEALVQISQPRQPCHKLGRRWNLPELPERVQATGRTGWYFRVLEEGMVAPGQDVALVDRPFPQWTVARCNDIMHHRRRDRELAAELAACPALSQSWVTTLSRRAQGRSTPDPRSRLYPETETEAP